VKYSKKYLDVRGGGKKSKAQRILEFLEREIGIGLSSLRT